MKAGVIGTGAVGAACAMALALRARVREIVLVNRNKARARGVATDMRYGLPLSPLVDLRAGDYADLANAGLVMITAGLNEKTGGATDRNDPAGRLRLIEKNAAVYRQIVPEVVKAAPDAVILVVTDPPDPLADLTRTLAGHDRVLSTGTYLDSLRFRVHLAERLGISPASVEAQIIGEHGTSGVFLWSSARIGGMKVAKALGRQGKPLDEFRREIERDVRYANITIIEGIGASQYGIGMVAARIAEVVLRDENAVFPIGCYNRQHEVTLSLPGVVGAEGVKQILRPDMSAEEEAGFAHSVEVLRKAAQAALRSG